MSARNLTFPAASGRPMRAFLATPDNPPDPAPAIILIHEFFGLNDDIRRIARRFAEAGYAALAPDLHDTGGPRFLCISRTMRDLGRGSGAPFDDLEAARLWLADRDDVDGERIGVAGFCMGGGFALLYAVGAPVKAAANFYGIVPKTQDELEGVCPVLGSYGALDTRLLPTAKRLDAHLTALNVDHDVQIYDGAGHSFMSQHEGIVGFIGGIWPLTRMHLGYEENAAEDSWRRMLAFFDRHVANPTE